MKNAILRWKIGVVLRWGVAEVWLGETLLLNICNIVAWIARIGSTAETQRRKNHNDITNDAGMSALRACFYASYGRHCRTTGRAKQLQVWNVYCRSKEVPSLSERN